MPRRLSILAGTGSLVTHVIEAAQRAGDDIQVIALMPQPERPGLVVLPGDTRDPMSIIWTIKAFRSTHITLAGGVTLGDRDSQNYDITSGLQGGDKVVADGAIFLQFMQSQ